MIRINPLFFVVIAVVFVLNLLPQFLTVFLIAILHEGAHAICAYFCCCEDIEFCIHPWGVCMKCKSFDSNLKELLVASAGPLLNLFLLMIFSILNREDGYIANLFMLIINLLPVYPLDGGRILNAILKTEFSFEVAKNVLKSVSVAITLVMFVSGCYLVYKTGVNFSVLIASLFLCLTSDKVDGDMQSDPFKKSFHYMVNSEQCADIILKFCTGKTATVFDITDVSGRYLGSITYKQVLEEIASCGYEIKFGEILEKRLLY